ncbi:MAG: hypothetical protein M1524_04405 [Patescibacteria group bacterium]|nr:hypothetical protein [Patescibacteria group bacterium]
MENEDEQWIKGNLGEEKESGGEFEFECFLSTDGKHTVRILAKTPEGRKDGLSYAQKVYDRILVRYGTKQAQAVKEYKNGGVHCKTCNAIAQEKSGTTKDGRAWKGIFCSAEKDHVEWVR